MRWPTSIWILMVGLILSLTLMAAMISDSIINKEEKMNTAEKTAYGVAGQAAPELQVAQWVDGNGEKMASFQLEDHPDKFKIIYCFQSWCPGCHSVGLPSLQKMVKEFGDNEKIEFVAIQTVFEGAESNTYEKMLETQKKYDLHIPFGHDVGDETTGNRSSTMYNFRTGGTPWFIFIDKEGTVIFNDFHVDTDKAIEFLRTELN